MSDNEQMGRDLYSIGDQETRDWFERQWKIWPVRADERLTTNLSFHYGGVTMYREIHGCDPVMSDDFALNVEWLDARTIKRFKNVYNI
jgi:hypothetical protein